ncbi:MAG: LysM domain-containing protein [Anaeromusa sp.]|uniref:LysM domain-containing protein n=1 Tax=Anaeromusa sp. TaxID=1872520 RepID=UPI002B21C9A1|nr:LysM domain-containing protein [Anaeromusa sp.]MEA4835331.1 LysM domain-containing protein [Anaeromusa sp.]
MKNLFVIAVLLLAYISIGAGEPAQPNDAELVSVVHIVRAGDTLDAIAAKYMQQNTVVEDIREFRESIIEQNKDVFADRRQRAMLMPGDRLHVNYWVRHE